MPKVTFGAEHKVANAFDYPKLYLDKGETARVLMIENEPTMEYIHTLRAPQIVNGKPVYEEVTKFGKTSVEPKYDFIGRHICVGSAEVIADKGVDVKGCPVCKASTETDAVKAPERRFAVHVVRYKTKPGTSNIQEPFGVELLIWTFPDRIFNQIVDAAEEWGDLRKHDFLLGPCENKTFQKFEIKVSAKAEWLTSDERRALVTETYKNNQAKDVTALIARRLGKDLVAEDLEKVLARHRQAFGKGAEDEDVPAPAEVAAGLDLDDLLGGAPVSEPTPAAAPAAADEVESKREEPKPAPAAAQAGAIEDLDDLLAGL